MAVCQEKKLKSINFRCGYDRNLVAYFFGPLCIFNPHWFSSYIWRYIIMFWIIDLLIVRSWCYYVNSNRWLMTEKFFYTSSGRYLDLSFVVVNGVFIHSCIVNCWIFSIFSTVLCMQLQCTERFAMRRNWKPFLLFVTCVAVNWMLVPLHGLWTFSGFHLLKFGFYFRFVFINILIWPHTTCQILTISVQRSGLQGGTKNHHFSLQYAALNHFHNLWHIIQYGKFATGWCIVTPPCKNLIRLQYFSDVCHV